MAGEQRVSEEWVGRRVELILKGDEHPCMGTLANVRDDGIELAEEEHPDPYGEDQAQQGTPAFYGYDSIVDLQPREGD